MEQPHSVDMNRCVIQVLTQRSLGTVVGSLSSAKDLGFEPGTFQFCHNAITY